MKCLECVKLGEKSQLRVLNSTTTCLSGDEYYDEDGRHHWHNPNTTAVEYVCSNGHRFTMAMKVGQCWCEAIADADALFKEEKVPEPPAAVVEVPADVNVTPQHKVEVKRRAPATGITDSLESLLGHPAD